MKSSTYKLLSAVLTLVAIVFCVATLQVPVDAQVSPYQRIITSGTAMPQNANLAPNVQEYLNVTTGAYYRLQPGGTWVLVQTAGGHLAPSVSDTSSTINSITTGTTPAASLTTGTGNGSLYLLVGSGTATLYLRSGTTWLAK